MNRKEEYDALMQELESVPTRLNYTVTRARAKSRRRKVRRCVWAPVSTLSAVCVAFMLLVNLSAPFAMACSKVPFLRDLAKAVSFSPSLSAAVENRWVQIIDQTDTDGDYTMTVECVMLDQKQLNVFYSVEGMDPEKHYQPRVDVLSGSGMEMTGFSVIMPDVNRVEELSNFSIDFTGEEDMPQELLLNVKLIEFDPYSEYEAAVGTFDFLLHFDPEFTAAGRTVEVNEWIELDGQRICLTTVEIYPTHVRVNFDSDPANTHWLRRLKLYAEDETCVRYDAGSPSGISATGNPNTPDMTSFRLNSNYFSEAEHLTIYLTGAEWLAKEDVWTWVDLATGETGFLPEKTTWMGYDRDETTLYLKFRAYEDIHGTMPELFSRWRIPGGEEQYIRSYGGGTAWDAERTQPLEGYFDVTVSVEGVTGDRVELKLYATDRTECATPIAIEVS